MDISAPTLAGEIGNRLSRRRLSRNITQQSLAESAGVSVRTVRRIEAGHSSTLENFLRVAQALKLDDALLAAIPSHDIRPIERIDSRRGAERQRARPKKSVERKAGWAWGDDR